MIDIKNIINYYTIIPGDNNYYYQRKYYASINEQML